MRFTAVRTGFFLGFAILTAGSSRVSLAQSNGAPALPIGQTAPIAPVTLLRNATSGIPPSGGLLLSSSDGSQPVVYVRDANGVELPGTLIARGNYYVWTPGAPLVLGASYTVELAAPYGGGPSTFVTFPVVAADTSVWPELVAAPTIASKQDGVDVVCCNTYPGLTSANCFPTAIMTHAQLAPMVTSTASPIVLDQLLFVTRAGVSESARAASSFQPWNLVNAAISFAQSATEYCFELDAINIVTGEVHAYADLTTRCVPNGDLPPLVTTPLDMPMLDVHLTREVCQVPPLGLEAAWCEQNGVVCAADRGATGCEGYGYACLDEPLPVQNIAGSSGGAAGAAGRDAVTIGGGGGFGGSPGEGTDRVSSAGCSAATGPTRQHGVPVAAPLILAGVLLVAHRRKRSRARR